jgi:hydrogenase-4 membrane subunit HyfE
MGVLAADFFKSDLTVWFTGAALLFTGLFVIAFHQYWSSVAAALISVFGWILALRGLVLLVAPDLYERAAVATDSVPLIRLIFALIIATGLYFTYVGWLAKPALPATKNDP